MQFYCSIYSHLVHSGESPAILTSYIQYRVIFLVAIYALCCLYTSNKTQGTDRVGLLGCSPT